MKRKPRPGKDGTPGSIRAPRWSDRTARRKPQVETESGPNVRSNYEKMSVAWFEKEGIEYRYEPLILLEGKQYRPDFYLPEYDLFVEICGYNHMPHYRDRVAKKEKAYRRSGLRALFIHFNGKGSLGKLLEKGLKDFENKRRS